MKFNILYLLIPAAIYGCYWIVSDLQGQSVFSFFGTAETEPQIISFDYDVVVQDVRVVPGKIVKKGDTIAILYRSDLDKTTLDRFSDMNQLEVERSAKNQTLMQERNVILAQQDVEIKQRQAQIKVLKLEDSIQMSFKKNIYNDDVKNRVSVKYEEIKALEEEIKQIEKQTQEQLKQIDAQKSANQMVVQSKISQVRKDLDYIKVEKNKLILTSPIDGFIEQVSIANNELAQKFKELIKINPKKPNKIIGFIHETAEVPFQLGDTVSLVSTTRPTVTTTGVIVGSSPKLVELPLRLRKFLEMRAWGREVFIQMTDTNHFYIGEKITANLQRTPLSK